MNKVFVSGGSGYIALHTIMLLLQKNYFVVTSVTDKYKIALIKNCLRENNIDISKIEFYILDLLYDQGWEEALKGCEYVLHMASPVIPGNVDMDLLVKPAVEGMTRCLNAAIKNKAKKFVLTSSYAAIYGNSKNKFSDNDWTDLNRKDLMPYEISKTKSEMGMWENVKNSKYQIDACSINPVLVLGPSISGIISMSNKQVLNRILRLPFIPKISLPIVGVRDVANAHLMAMENKNSNGKRFLISEKTVDLIHIAKILKSNNMNVSTLVVPDFIVRFLSFFVISLRAIAKRLNTTEHLETKNAKSILGFYPNSVDLEIVESVHQIQSKK
ncbi:MAG: NAD-dependent epimerase/dehydratase family protein [Flavobacteriaceae bacterium]|tara:strand:- start:83 stop:1066 length:984 start_codon:yes stop_codon:yes gene_type:complete